MMMMMMMVMLFSDDDYGVRLDYAKRRALPMRPPKRETKAVVVIIPRESPPPPPAAAAVRRAPTPSLLLSDLETPMEISNSEDAAAIVASSCKTRAVTMF